MFRSQIARILSCVAVISLAVPVPVQAKYVGGIIEDSALHHPVIGRFGMVASQNDLASRVGAEVLANGGNAVDAAVAVGYALSVTLPRAGNIGGGGFMMAYLADEDRTVAIDFREMSPEKAYRDMYLDENGDVDRHKSWFSHHASGVPGTVAGLEYARKKFGSKSRKALLKPAIDLAENGFPMTVFLADGLESVRGRMAPHKASMSKFFKKDGASYEPGEMFRQPLLAKTLKRISDKGEKEFYKGETAKLIVADQEAHGGMLSMKDMAAYKVIERPIVEGTYRGHKVVSMPPPSSGGVHIIQMLNVLEHFDLKSMGSNSADFIHTVSEVTKRAYADRSEHLGDPDFYNVPVAWLTDPAYARDLASSIDPHAATPSAKIKASKAPAYESPDTTHFSVMDAKGNAVVVTYTLNFSYGNSIVVPGGGFLMNNEMDDFSAKAGVPNEYGLIGGVANAIEPYKRPLSSMTPTIVFKAGKPYLLTGSPGGSRIITSVLQVILNVVDHGMNVADAGATPRFHHQWQPDEIRVERGFSADTIAELERRGHTVNVKPSMGSTQSIVYDGHYFYGASDPRRRNAGAIGICIKGEVGGC